MTNIKAKLIELHVGDFSTKKDKLEFKRLCKGLMSFNDGITITPYYSKEGELMSFIVDSKKAAKLIEDKDDFINEK